MIHLTTLGKTPILNTFHLGGRTSSSRSQQTPDLSASQGLLFRNVSDLEPASTVPSPPLPPSLSLFPLADSQDIDNTLILSTGSVHFFPTSIHSSTQSSPLSVVRSKRKKDVNENTDQNDTPEIGYRKYASNTLSALQTLDYSIHEIRDAATVSESLLPVPEDSKTTQKNSVYIHVQTFEQKTQDILQAIERLRPSMACHPSSFGIRLTTQPQQELNQ